MLATREIDINDDLVWDKLINDSSTATFFQTKDWLSLWIKHFGGEVKILGVFNDDNLIGIAPFQSKEGIVNFLGVSPVLEGELVSDFGDIIAKISYEEIVWKEILAKLKTPRPRRGEAEGGQISNVKSIGLNFIREDSPSLKISRIFVPLTGTGIKSLFNQKSN